MLGQRPFGRWILILLAVLLVAGGAAGGAFWMVRRKPAVVQAAPEGTGPLYTIGELVTNLNEPNRRAYIQVEVAVEVQDQKVRKELETRAAQVKNEVLVILRARSMEHVQGAEGMRRLAEDLQARLNSLLPDAGVRKVYFTEFVVQ